MQRRPNAPSRRPSTPFRRPPENPRLVALNVLQDVHQQGAYAQLALSTRLRAARGMDQRDKDLVTQLVNGTLEKQITLDYFIDARLERPDTEAVIRDILRLGAYQILFLTRVPESAAVDESVKLTRLLHRDVFSGLVNAVLRSIAREKDALPWPDAEKDAVGALSIRHAAPRWIVEKLLDAYGADEAERILAYAPTAHETPIRLNPGTITQEALEARMAGSGWTFTPAVVPGMYLVSGTGDIARAELFKEGLITVQGVASVLAAGAVPVKRGQSILDACAAPGGKTALIAEAMQGSGRVYAWDIHEHRVELIRRLARRLRLDNVRPAVRDATQVREDLLWTMDAVLIDAPCTGLGVMLEKPDVKLRRTPEDLAPLAQTQAALLFACAGYVKPGGTLVYSTCSLLPEENEDQVRAFLAAHADFAPDDDGLKAALPESLRGHVADGMVQFLPYRDGIDGFFIARLKRTGR